MIAVPCRQAAEHNRRSTRFNGRQALPPWDPGDLVCYVKGSTGNLPSRKRGLR
jgi:hypothetical protein